MKKQAEKKSHHYDSYRPQELSEQSSEQKSINPHSHQLADNIGVALTSWRKVGFDRNGRLNEWEQNRENNVQT